MCWAHLIRDLTAIAERPGASTQFGAELLGLQQQLFGHWHHYKDGTIDWPSLQQSCQPIRQAFEATLHRVVELGAQRGERTAVPRRGVPTPERILRRNGFPTTPRSPLALSACSPDLLNPCFCNFSSCNVSSPIHRFLI